MPVFIWYIILLKFLNPLFQVSSEDIQIWRYQKGFLIVLLHPQECLLETIIPFRLEWVTILHNIANYKYFSLSFAAWIILFEFRSEWILTRHAIAIPLKIFNKVLWTIFKWVIQFGIKFPCICKIELCMNICKLCVLILSYKLHS